MASKLGCTNCLDNIAAFKDYKEKYTPTFIDGIVAEVDAAQALPNVYTRNQKRTALRVPLSEAAQSGFDLWHKLKGYIGDAWPKNLLEDKLLAAGSAFYAEAANGNRPALQSLLTQGKSFIDEYANKLQANNNMPVAFVQLYGNACDDCVKLAKKYSVADVIKLEGRTAKVKANNAVYDNISSICRDGQIIFRKSEKKKFFVFEELVSMIGKGGVTGLKVLCTIEGKAGVAEGVTITDTTGAYSAVSNTKGRAFIKQMLAGTYTFTFEFPGLNPITKVIKFKPGKTRRFKLVFTEAEALSVTV